MALPNIALIKRVRTVFIFNSMVDLVGLDDGREFRADGAFRARLVVLSHQNSEGSNTFRTSRPTALVTTCFGKAANSETHLAVLMVLIVVRRADATRVIPARSFVTVRSLHAGLASRQET